MENSDPKFAAVHLDRSGGLPGTSRHHFSPPGWDEWKSCEKCGLPGYAVEHRCGDCGVLPGLPHEHGCDVERCQITGMQWIMCGGWSDRDPCSCEDRNGYDDEGFITHTCGQSPHDCGSEVWLGFWAMERDAVALDLWCRWGPGWIPCERDHPDATPDLNRLVSEGAWNPATARWEAR